MEMENKIQNHEERIQKLEKNDIERKVQLTNIEKSQSDIKLMINEISRDQRKALTDFTDKMLNSFTTTLENKDKLKFYNTKEFWAICVAVSTAIVTYLSVK